MESPIITYMNDVERDELGGSFIGEQIRFTSFLTVTNSEGKPERFSGTMVGIFASLVWLTCNEEAGTTSALAGRLTLSDGTAVLIYSY